MKYSILLILILACSAFGQSNAIVKGDLVVPKFPKAAIKFDKIKIWQAKVQFSANISKSPEGKYLVNNSEIKPVPFPIIATYKVDEVEVSKKKPTRILLKSLENQIELTFSGDLNLQDVLSNILYKGTAETFVDSDYFRKIESKVLPTIFNGLDSIPFEAQRSLMHDVDYYILAYGISKFKDKDYLRIKYTDDSVYNTLQLNQAERNARETETAIKKLKAVYERTGKVKEVAGIKVETAIASKSFLDKYGKAKEEKYELYVPFDLLKKFIDAEITNQDLVDGSIILVEGNRVKINLTNYS